MPAWGHSLQSTPARTDIIEEDKNTSLFLSSRYSFVMNAVTARHSSQVSLLESPGAFPGSGTKEWSSDL